MKTLITNKTLKEKGFKREDLDNDIIVWEKDNIILERMPINLGGKYALRKRIDKYNSEYLGLVKTWEDINVFNQKLKQR